MGDHTAETTLSQQMMSAAIESDEGIMHEHDYDDLLDGDDEWVREGKGLTRPLQETQMEEEGDEEYDDPAQTHLKEALKVEHPTLNSISHAMNVILERRHTLLQGGGAGKNVFEKMEGMHTVIALPEGDKKNADTTKYNLASLVLTAGRHDDEFLDFPDWAVDEWSMEDIQSFFDSCGEWQPDRA